LNNGTCNVTNAGSFVCLRYMLNNLEFSLDNSIITLWRIIKINMNVTNLFSRVNNLSIKAYFTSETAFNNLKPIIDQLISDISSIYISSIDDPLFADNLIQIIEQALNQINIIIPNS
jgi:hypothetical protein